MNTKKKREPFEMGAGDWILFIGICIIILMLIGYIGLLIDKNNK
tara:strand:+ start:1105 stop:1236 length:132 start_codon:yes stop_codon:yes gene_type:complete